MGDEGAGQAQQQLSEEKREVEGPGPPHLSSQ